MKIKDLRQIRERKGVTQVKCSKDTNIPLRTYQRYEMGENIGDPEYLCRLMIYFNIKPTDLVE